MLYLLLVFALLLIGVSRLLSLLTVGDEAKIIKDVGLSAISIFGVLTAVFVGVSLVFKEIEKRTIYIMLARPVRRWEFILGKYLGLMTVLAASLAASDARGLSSPWQPSLPLPPGFVSAQQDWSSSDSSSSLSPGLMREMSGAARNSPDSASVEPATGQSPPERSSSEPSSPTVRRWSGAGGERCSCGF